MNEILLTAISCVVSVAGTLIVAHLYYRKSIRDLEGSNADLLRSNDALKDDIQRLEAMLGKLPDSVVEKLAAEQRRQLSLDELEELIQEADAYPTEYGLFPNKCPKCGEPTTIRGQGPTEYSEAEAWPACPSCGWNGG